MATLDEVKQSLAALQAQLQDDTKCKGVDDLFRARRDDKYDDELSKAMERTSGILQTVLDPGNQFTGATVKSSLNPPLRKLLPLLDEARKANQPYTWYNNVWRKTQRDAQEMYALADSCKEQLKSLQADAAASKYPPSLYRGNSIGPTGRLF